MLLPLIVIPLLLSPPPIQARTRTIPKTLVMLEGEETVEAEGKVQRRRDEVGEGKIAMTKVHLEEATAEIGVERKWNQEVRKITEEVEIMKTGTSRQAKIETGMEEIDETIGATDGRNRNMDCTLLGSTSCRLEILEGCL